MLVNILAISVSWVVRIVAMRFAPFSNVCQYAIDRVFAKVCCV